MTRGSLTTFSIANDVAKYFAIIPALFMGLYPACEAEYYGASQCRECDLLSHYLQCPDHHRIDTAGIEGSQIPRSLRRKLLSRNLLVYGVGGIIAPFICIKLIDMLLVLTGLF